MERGVYRRVRGVVNTKRSFADHAYDVKWCIRPAIIGFMSALLQLLDTRQVITGMVHARALPGTPAAELDIDAVCVVAVCLSSFAGG